MKGLFPQFEEPSAKDHKSIWGEALFVFDTNVLLNLYRYQLPTRNELLGILDGLSDRIWIPHHVALEFQRNRLTVIADQNRRFADVRKAVEKARSGLITDLEALQLRTRHSSINPQPIIDTITKVVSDFLAELDQLRASQQVLSAHDPLKNRIEDLFITKVGAAPHSQNDIDDLYKQAEIRFKRKTPPGYADGSKDKDAVSEYVAGGVVYQRRYGDFLVWMQILAYAKEASHRSVVFVTDDAKEDWWLKVDEDGSKTIGPRPELIEEAALSAGIQSFLMYSPESFLKYAGKFLETQVSDDVLQEVRDVSTHRSMQSDDAFERIPFSARAESAVCEWLIRLYSQLEIGSGSAPEIIAFRDDSRDAFYVMAAGSSPFMAKRLRGKLLKATVAIHEKRFANVTIVLVASTPRRTRDLPRVIAGLATDDIPNSLRFVTGVIVRNRSGVEELEVFSEFSIAECRSER
ncbi:PIN-like domain-containing protein [Planctellipticum variicoloris]|uniref:PIN-like domain-containing protein n=1 Tax=Planctellipticum variicoloris TaxID=3064265 RepID=UPI0030140B2B|nr:PIN domain-containing protein [Planctomycetaceae bacterium SH412]